jgi:hypothetical protein
MMKIFCILLPLSLLLLQAGAIVRGAHPSPGENQYVKAAFSLTAKTLKAGGKGELQITLKPRDGIHINLTPAVTVSLDTLGGAVAPGPPDIPKAQKKEYLDTSRPIKQPFTLSRDLKPGPLVLKGVVTYFYCSAAEGWCSRYKQPIEVTVTVVP